MECMRLPVLHFHHVVAAGLILMPIGMQAAYAQQDPRRVIPETRIQVPDTPPQDESGDAPAAGIADEPAEAPELTAEARLREREDLDLLFAELAQPEGESWARAETDILRIWSRSGSAAMDLLYKRGETALDGGDTAGAIGHLTALTDHAPDFAAGWHLRAVAFYLNGDFGPAMADLERVLALEPRQFAALTQLGVMLEELGDRDRALQAYRESLKIHPHQQDAADAARRLEQETQGTDA
ncbi:MAG: tetratricopeptide repeat protein [Paracoccus sp. (in: a-proteobacteria)]